ncbi:MAG: pentapeptide repeat-containing protein, partial [Thermoguttaceae bacterium]
MGNLVAKKWNLKILVLVFLLMSGVSQTQADIYEWAYVNPSDPSQGVVQSSVVCPGGSSVSAVPSVNLANLDLTQAYLIGADLEAATLTNANLTNANLSNASLVYSRLTNADLTGANLTNADVASSRLTNANLTGATVAGTNFLNSNFTASQLYSTASYQVQNLQGIELYDLNLTGGDLSGQNLTNAWLYDGTLARADLTGANLTNTKLTYADLTGADLRGAQGLHLDTTTTTTNTILPDGTINGLSLDSPNHPLLVRNYRANIPIHILQGMSMNTGASLVLEFDGAPWGSTISFASGIRVRLNGNLELDLAAGVNPAGLVGDSFQV